MTRVRYSRAHRTLEVAAIVVTCALSLALGWTTGVTLDGLESWAVLAASAFGAWVAADFLSGLVHWLADRYGSPSTPIVGESFVRPFREHHVDPTDITRHDVVETCGTNCMLCVFPMAMVLCLVPVEAGSLASTAAHGGMLFLALACFATNQIHKWSHMPDVPLPLRGLQRLRLILSREHHERHHAAPHDSHYCITTGWLNPLLNRYKVFRRLEWLIERTTGARAGRDHVPMVEAAAGT